MKTWGTMKSEIVSECNIEGEDFASEEELLTWANEGKDMAEKEIVSLYDKYLETEAELVMTNGSQFVNLPEDIYANKITLLQYSGDNDTYEVKLIKDKRKIMLVESEDDYSYRIDNSTMNGSRIKLYPASRESSTGVLSCHYIRESQDIDDDDSLMDIPLADNFIKQYVKDKIKEKEIGPMNVTDFSPALRRERDLLIEALNHMIPSESADEIDIDTEFYENFDMNDFGDIN